MLQYSNYLGAINFSKKYLIKTVTEIAESCYGIAGLDKVELVKVGEAVDVKLTVKAAENVNLPAAANAVAHKTAYVLTKSGIDVRSVHIYTDELISWDI